MLDIDKKYRTQEQVFIWLKSVSCYFHFLLKCILFTEVKSPFSLVDGTSNSVTKSTNSSKRSFQQHSSYQIPASALYESSEDQSASVTSPHSVSAGRMSNFTNQVLLLYEDE